jgi:hypothetical protein
VISFLRTIGVPLLILIVLFGCSNDPNSTGYSLLPSQDSLQVLSRTFYATGDTTFRARISAVSQTILVGQSQGLEADAILRFGGLASIPATSILDSARLNLHINYRFKDSTGNFGLEVRRMTRTITSPTWDSLSIPGIYSDTISGRLLVAFSPLDTLLSIPIDTALVRLWMGSNGGSVLLLPTATIVLGLSYTITTALDGRPELAVTYHSATGTTAPVFSVRSTSGSFAADGNLPLAANRTVVQSGIVDRSIVRFDSLRIPLRSSVVQAFLRIAVDTAASLTNTYTRDNVFASLMRKNVYPYDSLALTTTMSSVTENGQKYYQADVRPIVQQWLLHAPNYGLQLKAAGETTTFDRFVLYGTGVDSTLTPRLVVTYTLLP